MEPEPKTLRIPRGRAWSETWAFADDDDVRADITGCTGTFQIYPASGTTPLVTGTVTISDADQGEVLIELSEDDVAELAEVRVAHWLLELTDTLGAVHDARGPVWMEDGA